MGAWGALGQVGGAVGNEILNVGSSIGGAAFNAYLTRDLRRTAYQDMMHSMREAGLNPMLASGATPGYANTGTAQIKTDFARSAKDVGEASKAPNQRALLEAQTTQATANARQAEAQAQTAEAIRDAQLEELRAKAEGHRAGAFEATTGGYRNQADTDLKVGEREAGLPAARADLARSQGDRIRAELAADLPAAIAEANRRAAGLSSAREEGTRYQNVEYRIDADWLNDFETMVRMGKSYDAIVDRLGPVADIVLKGRASVLTGRRDRNSNAKDAQRQENDYYRARQAEREQDRRDRAERRNFPSQ